MKTFKPATVFACVALLAAQAVSAGSLPFTTAPASTSLTKDNLVDFLHYMGYDPSPRGNGDFWISAPLFGKTQSIGVGMSKDSTRLWIYAKIGTLPNLAGIPAGTFSKLLLANEQYAPAYFSIERCEKCNADGRYLVWFNDSLENRGITPASLRAAVDSLVKNLTKSVDVWDDKNLTR